MKLTPDVQPTQPQPNPERMDTPPLLRIGLQHLPPGLHIGKLSDVGRERERNEDTLYLVEAFIQHDVGTEPFGLFIVADGMGGHQKGEIASSLAARVAANTIFEEIYLPYLINKPSTDSRPLKEVLAVAVEQANAAVIKEVPEGGTTLTIALIMGHNAYIAHVGDTRVYLFQQNKLKQITQDHSLAQRLQQLGQSTADEVKHVQNVLYKAVGQGDTIEVDTYIQYLPPGSTLLLCSDGLWGLVNDDNMATVLKLASSPQAACQQLIDLANAGGGRDNITAIVVAVGSENLPK